MYENKQYCNYNVIRKVNKSACIEYEWIVLMLVSMLCIIT